MHSVRDLIAEGLGLEPHVLNAHMLWSRFALRRSVHVLPARRQRPSFSA